MIYILSNNFQKWDFLPECCHGDNEEKVYRKLCQIVDEWIEI
jgi:predicted HicB family RNase H-like nuclease